MAITQNTFTGNGSTVLYSFTFPYLEESDIKVSLNGTLTTAYTLANAPDRKNSTLLLLMELLFGFTERLR